MFSTWSVKFTWSLCWCLCFFLYFIFESFFYRGPPSIPESFRLCHTWFGGQYLTCSLAFSIITLFFSNVASTTLFATAMRWGTRSGNLPRNSATATFCLPSRRAVLFWLIHEILRVYSPFWVCFAYARCRIITDSGGGWGSSGLIIRCLPPFVLYMMVMAGGAEVRTPRGGHRFSSSVAGAEVIVARWWAIWSNSYAEGSTGGENNYHFRECSRRGDWLQEFAVFIMEETVIMNQVIIGRMLHIIEISYDSSFL